MQNNQIEITDYPNKTLIIDSNNLDNLDSLIPTNSILFIDEKVFKLHNLNFRNKILYIIKSTEKNKSIKTVERIIDFLVNKCISKDYTLIAIGGGIVSDLISFVASIYKRGINHILVPSTLLSMVDASYGGKTGINFNNNKNLIGTYKFPVFILISTNFLKTLSLIEIKNGFCEIIKISFTSNFKLFNYLFENSFKSIDFNYLIKESILAKEKILKSDLYDNNYRKVLNFGHTFGHILELNYKLKHGIAILNGALLELNILNKIGINTEFYIEVLKELMLKHKIKLINFDNLKLNFDSIVNDKKFQNGKISLIKPLEIGKSELIDIDLKELKNIINDLFSL